MEKLSDLVPGIVKVDLLPGKGGRITVEATRHINPLGIQRAVSMLLSNFGVDTKGENFKETPKRVTKMWQEWLSPKTVELKVFSTQSKGAVTLTGHNTVCVCPHHLLPFEMVVDLAYLPQGYAVGLSKLARFIDLACASFALQEDVPEFVVKIIDALLLPRGVICRTRARHGCMRLRGVRTTGEVTTMSLSGAYLTDEKARYEFLREVE